MNMNENKGVVSSNAGGTGVEEFLEGYQIFWLRLLGYKIFGEIAEYLMGCESFGIYFRLK